MEDILKKNTVEQELEGLMNKVKEAPGFVLFLGVLGRGQDSDGNIPLHFSYLKSKLSFEDSQKAVRQFEKDLMNDLMKRS